MPKLIDYPRTSYTGAWELAEITDDTGGKSTIETAARKLNRKVSGSFKAIIGSAVKFGLVTSKREMLTTTTLFKRIKHAYDKQEELLFHREAFLTPPLFTQLCRKFRSRELPVQMLDVMLIREFGVEEINAQGVAKAFVDGARMVGLLDEHNTITDIDALAASQTPRRQLATTTPPFTSFQPEKGESTFVNTTDSQAEDVSENPLGLYREKPQQTARTVPAAQNNLDNPTHNTNQDAIASLFGLLDNEATKSQASTLTPASEVEPTVTLKSSPEMESVVTATQRTATTTTQTTNQAAVNTAYQIQISGPGVNTVLSISEDEDIALAIAMLEKIRRQLKSN